MEIQDILFASLAGLFFIYLITKFLEFKDLPPGKL